MGQKLKALGVGLLAIITASFFTVTDATALSGGHFVTPSAETLIKGEESGSHRLEFTIHGVEGSIVCNEAQYVDNQNVGETAVEVLIIPSYGECHTTGSETGIPIHMNQCRYLFTVAEELFTEQTAHLICPGSATIVITHPNCTITIAPQTILGGLTYERVIEEEKYAITLVSKAVFNVQFHGGVCILVGTNHTGTLSGSVTVRAFEYPKGGKQIDLKAT